MIVIVAVVLAFVSGFALGRVVGNYRCNQERAQEALHRACAKPGTEVCADCGAVWARVDDRPGHRVCFHLDTCPQWAKLR